VHAVSELDILLPRADVVILILPATAESRGLIGERQLGLLRQGALLVNAARGPIVDTDALVNALNSERIRAALDVTEPEPLPEGHRCALSQPFAHAAYRRSTPQLRRVHCASLPMSCDAI